MSPNPMLRLNSLWLMKKLRCDAQVQARRDGGRGPLMSGGMLFLLTTESKSKSN